MDDLKDENEQYRKMVMETIEKVTYHIISHHPSVRKPVPTIWFRVKPLIEFHEQFSGKKDQNYLQNRKLNSKITPNLSLCFFPTLN